MKKTKVLGIILAVSLVVPSVFVTDVFADEGDQKTITILGTSDLHGRIYPYEYAVDSAQEVGFAKDATIIKEAREIDPELILVDTGDSIESNMIDLFNDDDIHPMIKALNLLDYDTWTIGNHEFNFGLDVLNNAIDDFNGSVLSANIVNSADGSYFVDPYTIVSSQGVDVAIIGMTAPYIEVWEASTPEHFEGLEFLDPEVSLQKTVDYINENEDVDLVVGAFHIGMDGEDYDDSITDNAREMLEDVDGLDGAFLAHSHDAYGFSDDQVYVDDTIVLEPGSYGSYVGVMQFDVVETADGSYDVVDKRTDLISVDGVEPDQEVLDTFAYVDERSKAAANEVIGTATGDFLPEDEFKGIPSAQIQDTAVIDLINEVQKFYSGADISASALFDTRSNIKEGEVKFKDAALIYKYSNTLQAHKINGKQLKEYMEWSASFYNTVQPGDVTVSFDENIRGYMYDMFSGVDYKIDVSEEPGNRIKDLTFNGEPVTDDMEFTLAINNYRVGTLQSLGILPADGSSKVYDSMDTAVPEMQRLIQKYIVEEKDGVISPDVDNNWELINTPADSAEKESVRYLVNNDYITLPTSKDGRTLNVKSINVLEALPQDATQIELLNSEKLDKDIKATLESDIANGTLTNYGELYNEATTLIKASVDTITPEVPVEPVVPIAPIEPETDDFYTVVSGDTLYSIGVSHGTTWQVLADINNLSNPNLIFPEQLLKLK